MPAPVDLNPRIVDMLYAEALDLADRSRAAFEAAGLPGAPVRSVAARMMLAREAMRATTRMMHGIAWLLNQRAYLAGQMTEFQLRRHGRLPPATPTIAPHGVSAGVSARLAPLDPRIRAIVLETERFYARLVRFDTAWQQGFATAPGAVRRLRERLGRTVEVA